MAMFKHLLLLLGLLPALLVGLAACDDCATDYTACTPEGSSLRDVPIPGPDLGRLYLEMLYTVKDVPPAGSKVGPTRRVDGKTLCCALNTACMLTNSFHIALCYDRFTTDYFLPDGSYGALANGSYTSSAGDVADLITGEYKLTNGETGNMYDQDPADKPDTSELPMPTPWTSSGVGSAIPGSQLGATTPMGMDLTSSSSTAAGSTPTTAASASESSSSTAAVSTSTTPTSASNSSTSASDSSMATITSSATLSQASTLSVTSSYSGYGGYGFPPSNTTIAGASASATGTSGASMVSTFTNSPIVPYVNMAAASLICYVAPGFLISTLAALFVG